MRWWRCCGGWLLRKRLYEAVADALVSRSSGATRARDWLQLSRFLHTDRRDTLGPGRGIGRRLIEPTLGDADAAHVDCYLETFDGRNTGFYRRLGFAEVASHAEWVTGVTYTIMRRHPRR